MPMTILTIEQVNSITSDHFIKIFGNVVEHFPPAAIAILKNRPFDHPDKICDAFNGFLEKLTFEEKQLILNLYPDLVAKLGNLSRIMLEIEQYQRVFGAERLTIEDKQKLSHLNKIYKQKFGFPFILAGKANVFTLFHQIGKRLQNSIETETRKAIEEVKKIGKIRIYEILRT